MAYRRPKSLRDFLVRAKLKPDMRDDEPLGETRPCCKARCKTDKMIIPTQIAKSASWATIKFRCNTGWKTTSVSCLMENNMLVKPVIMWTNRWTAAGMIGNISGSRGLLPQNTSVLQNIISTALCYLDHNPEWTDRTRKARESYWIRHLNTLWPLKIWYQQGRPVEGSIVP